MNDRLCVWNAGSDAAQGTVIFYNYALAFNPAKSRLALEEKNIKVRQSYISRLVSRFSVRFHVRT